MHLQLTLEQSDNRKNSMFSGNEVPSQLGLLLVDDEEFNLKALKRVLRGHGFKIFTAKDGVTALEVMENEDIAIIVSDMRMPNMPGDQLLKKIDDRWPDTLKIILTGYTDISDTITLLHSSSIHRYISKPWDDEFLLSTIHEAAAIYWGKVMDYFFEQSTKEQNEKLKNSNLQLRHSVDQSHTQLKKINKKLKDAYEAEMKQRHEKNEAERVSIAKSRFLATMSHEIRTPLNSVMATNALLLESDLTDEQADLVKLSLNGATTLLSLINDILDFSKINAGKLELSCDWFNIIDLIEETTELLSGQIVNKPVELISIVHPNAPFQVYGDKIRIKQIITNLISNALKFTESGCVQVELYTSNDLHLSVKDTGIGMSSENLDTIFNEFTQVDNSSTRVAGGTGLGLSICKELTQLMQGQISVESKPNIGSCFTLKLPLKQHNPIALPAVEGKQKKCLLFTKNIPLHRALSTQLLYLNCHLEQAVSPNNIAFSQYDSILYDSDSIQFFETSKNWITNNSVSKNSCSHIALIANDGVGRADKLKKIGFDAVLRKPLRISSLLKYFLKNLSPTLCTYGLNTHQQQIVDQWLNTPNLAQQKPKPSTIKAHILVAEDSPSNQAVVNAILRNINIEVDIANNGEEAVNLAQHKKYDAILMDMAMPIKDGISATQDIKQNAGPNQNTPIIALTANACTDDINRCHNAGMSDFISKPIDIVQFREKIERWIDNAHDHAIEDTEPKKTEPNNNEIIDLRVIAQLEKDTTKEVLPAIIAIYIQETEKRIPDMLEYAHNENWQHVSNEAHTLKSSSGSFGAIALQELAKAIEQTIKNGDSTATQVLINQLTPLAQKSISALRGLHAH